MRLWRPISAVAGLALILTVPAGHAARRTAVSVRISVVTRAVAARQVRSFTLTCNPDGGTLPFAVRICRDVQRHPKAMLDPPKPGPPRTSSVCAGGPGMPFVSVRATRGSVSRSFSGSPGCDWPGGQSLSVYYDAATRESKYLPLSELELRCDEDPALLAVPTPNASVAACRHGLWTPRAERLIRIAKHAAALSVVRTATLFPHDVGALPCVIHAGAPGRSWAGVCGVTIRDPWGTATVSFTEAWPPVPGAPRTERHTWHVAIRHGRAVAVTQEGPAPPQLYP